tara:strand:+ start:22 stop:153 length:132 start_codon:yes stop_codon:yes gene_type:complete
MEDFRVVNHTIRMAEEVITEIDFSSLSVSLTLSLSFRNQTFEE